MLNTTAEISMEELLKNFPQFVMPRPGELIEGTVISVNNNKVVVDLNGVLTGLITGKEAKDSGDTLKSLNIGDKVFASVVEVENEDGMVVLSLRKASQQKTWKHFVDAYENGTTIDVIAKEANKGGLLLDVDGIKGFIPVSQLAPLNYPRVNGADSNMILQRLQRLVNKTFKVKIINIDEESGKLILSEKAAYQAQRSKSLSGLKVGDKVKGVISGVVKFGIFVAFEGLEGLVHISEIAWGHVSDPSFYGKLGQEVEVLVIGIEGEKISLSLKRLHPDPWADAVKKFKVGDIVDGEVNRITQFGIFVKLSDDINGLIHLTELGENVKDANAIAKIGDKLKTKIISLDFNEHRIGLSLNLDYKIEGEAKKTEEKKPSKDLLDLVEDKKDEQAEPLSDDTKVEEIKAISKKYAGILVNAGYKNVKDLKKASLDDLMALEGIGKISAEKIMKAVN